MHKYHLLERKRSDYDTLCSWRYDGATDPITLHKRIYDIETTRLFILCSHKATTSDVPDTIGFLFDLFHSNVK
ncbi:hypothetical protein PUN28_011658 [Cardiocondyla obscurior]|uniref:Uncharacterized protein n=1 Tax=Cardiocondyla obscurior TaxID=286306 RepID=A0AAW2FIC2_9HYME